MFILSNGQSASSNYLLDWFKTIYLFLQEGGRAADAPSNADATTSKTTTDRVAEQSTGQVTSVITKCKDVVVEIGTEMNTASKELMKALGRISLALFGITVSGVNGVSQVASVTGKAVASGVKTISQPIGKIPLIGTLANGTQALVVNVADTFDKNSKFASNKRVEMVTSMRADLNNYSPQSGMTVMAKEAQQSSTTESTNAAEKTSA